MKQQLVNALLSYLRYFAKQAIKKNRPTIIGITGTAGKSSTREIVATILKDHYPTHVVSGNSETGIPLGILGIKLHSLGFQTPIKSIIDWLRILCLAPFKTQSLKGIQYLIVEMGIDDPYPPRNMEYLLTIVIPDIAIFLNTFSGAVHSMQFEKVLPTDRVLSDIEKRELKTQAIAAEKAKIITQSHCKVGIYNADNEYVVGALRSHMHSNHTLLSFGKDNKNDISYAGYEVSTKGTTFFYAVKNHKEKITITLPKYILQEEYQQSIAAAFLAALQTPLKPAQIAASLEKKFSLPNSRASIFEGIHNSLIIDSSYNASRPTIEGMLHLLEQLKKQTKRKIVFLFGDMRELGNESQHEHEIVAKKMSGIVDYLFLVGPQTREYVLPIIQSNEKDFKEIRWFDNSIRAGEYLAENLPKDSILLAKGSQNTIFLEEAVKILLKNKSDGEKLCRQEEYWLKKKSTFFQKPLIK